MVELSGGTFKMGSNEDRTEQPVHLVRVKSFLVGKYPVTVEMEAMYARQGVQLCRAR